MQEEGLIEYHIDTPLESQKVSKQQVIENEDALIKTTVELHLDSDKVPEH